MFLRYIVHKWGNDIHWGGIWIPGSHNMLSSEDTVSTGSSIARTMTFAELLCLFPVEIWH